jgi:hypothetical protein
MARALRSGPLLGYTTPPMAFKSLPYHSALELQKLILATARKDSTTPSALAQLARAWSDLEERKRIMKMKPKPKDVDITKQMRRARWPAFSEPVEPMEPEQTIDHSSPQ